MGLLCGILGDTGVFLRLIDLPIHTGQGLLSLDQSGLLLLLLLLSRSKLLECLEKLFLRLKEPVLDKGNLLPTALCRKNEA